MNPELAAALALLKTMSEAEIDRLQSLIDNEEEKETIDDETIDKLTEQFTELEDIIEHIDSYQDLTKE